MNGILLSSALFSLIVSCGDASQEKVNSRTQDSSQATAESTYSTNLAEKSDAESAKSEKQPTSKLILQGQMKGASVYQVSVSSSGRTASLSLVMPGKKMGDLYIGRLTTEVGSCATTYRFSGKLANEKKSITLNSKIPIVPKKGVICSKEYLEKNSKAVIVPLVSDVKGDTLIGALSAKIEAPTPLPGPVLKPTPSPKDDPKDPSK